MVYNEAQKRTIAKYLQNKFMAGEAEGHEIVIALVSMVKARRLLQEDVLPILTTVYFNNTQGVLKALTKAYKVMDDNMIKEIVDEMTNK